jgi:hypothetical protein
MTHEIQRRADGRQQPSSLPAVPEVPSFDPELLKLRLQYFGWTTVPSTLLLTAMTGGQFGESALLAALVGGAVSYFGPNVQRAIEPALQTAGQAVAYLGRNNSGRTQHRLLDKQWWLTGEATIPYAEPDQRELREVQEEDIQKTIKRPQPEEWDESWYGGDEEEEEIVGPLGNSGKLTFSDVLASGFVPSLSAICIGRLDDGRLLTVAAKDLCHVALPGASGHGKSSLIRLLMAQLCYCGLPVYLLNPHYMVFDREHNEDWTPFTPYLKADPFACKDMPNIKTVLDWMVNKLLPQRKERTAKGGKVGKPYFFILDEVPDIVKAIPGASKMIGKLLREGRKYGIYLIVASQDFSVKTLDVEGEGGVRKCFHTILYVGGDPVSVRELLNAKGGKVGELEIDENALGKGPIIARYMVRDTKRDTLVTVVTEAQAPYTDNDSLYMLLGPSTFVPGDDEPEQEPPQMVQPSFPAISQQKPTRNLGNDPENSMEMAREASPSNIISDVFPFHGKEMGAISRSDLQVSDEKLEMIRQMKERNYQDSEIALLVKLSGRKYQMYKQCLLYLGYKLAKEG